MINIIEAYKKYRENPFKLTKEEKLELIFFCDFEVKKEEGYYRLEDLQGAN